MDKNNLSPNKPFHLLTFFITFMFLGLSFAYIFICLFIYVSMMFLHRPFRNSY